MSRAQASASASDLTVFWNSNSSAGSSSRDSSRKSTRSASLNGRPARGQPSCSSRRYWGMVPTSLMPWAAEAARPSRFPPQIPVSFCFLTTASAALDSATARWAASIVSGGA